MNTPEEIDAQINKSIEESAAKQLDKHWETVWNMCATLSGNCINEEGVFLCLNKEALRTVFDAGYSAASNGVGIPMRMLSVAPPVEKKD